LIQRVIEGEVGKVRTSLKVMSPYLYQRRHSAMLWAAEGSACLRRSSSIVWREGGFDARCLSVYYAK
jgi:hypothetical protein